MQGQWTRWEPIKQKVEELDDLISCCDDHKTGLTIILGELKDKKKIYHFHWKHSVSAYKKTQERLSGMLIHDLDKMYGTSFYCCWNFFKVANSQYLQELSQHPGGLINDGRMHFVIFTFDTVLEVIANYEPEVTIINLPENQIYP